MASVREEDVALVHPVDSDEPKKKYGFIPALAISINYIIGTGVFGLPFAFYSSGILLGLICLTVSGFFSILCINWVLEVLARAEGVVKQKESGSNDPPVHQITWRKFDFTTLFATFIGWKGKAFCQFTICCYCYGVLWAYSAVFSSSVSSLFFQFALDEQCSIYNDPSASCNMAYHISLLIYVCIVVPMSCLDMGEQAIIQMVMTIYRFAAFGVMLLTVLVAFAHPRPDFRPGVAFQGVSAFDISGFAIVFTSGAVALNFHYNLPDIAKPVTNKLALTRIVSAAQVIAFGFYVLLACLCASYFGNATEPLVTLNWQSYTGIAGGWGGKLADRYWFSYVVQLFIMLFPVFDMLSVFPLVAITLGNNIFDSLRPYMKYRLSDKKLGILCRLIAAIPPAIAAAALGELNEIFTFAGLFAFFLELIFPCILLLVSANYCKKNWGPGSENNPYTLFFSKPGFAYAALVFGGVALIFAIINFAAPSLFK